MEKPVRNEDTIASSNPQRAQGSIKVAQSNPRGEREVRDDLKSDAARKNAGDTKGYRREAAEETYSEVYDIEDKETKEALQWLGTERESLAKIPYVIKAQSGPQGPNLSFWPVRRPPL